MRVIVLVLLVALLLGTAAGCSGIGAAALQTTTTQNVAVKNESSQPEKTAEALSEAELKALKADVAMPEQTLEDIVQSEGYTIDFSNSADGYITVSSEEVPEKKIKVQVSKGDEKYFYNFDAVSPFETYPLQMGDGDYTVIIFENIEDDKYAQLLAADRNVTLKSEFAPYLLPSKIVDYTQDSEAVTKSFELTEAAQSDLERVADIYEYIVDHIQYDYPKRTVWSRDTCLMWMRRLKPKRAFATIIPR